MEIVADGLGWTKVADDGSNAQPAISPPDNDSEAEQPNTPYDAAHPLDFPELSAQTREKLSWRGTTTLGELMMLSEADLLKSRGIGRKALKEIRGALAVRGLRLPRKMEGSGGVNS
jgi:DNA-directed RNA polymerase subunit alpha